MASVYYLIDDARDIADYIIWSTDEKFELDKKRYFAALVIQRTFRGFAVRCQYMNIVKSAIIIQKYVRGYLLRIHLHEIAASTFKEKCMRTFNTLATKIQAAWRGYWARKNFNIDEILNERKEEQDTQAAISDLFGKIFRSRQPGQSDYSLDMDGVGMGEMSEEDRIARSASKKSPEILQSLFEKHHLLRTYQIEGVLSEHGSKELSLIEKFLKKLDCKEYMTNVRKLYEEDNTPNFEYIFRNKKARMIEDMLREHKHREGVEKKESINKKIPRCIHPKPFVLNKKLEEEPYEMRMLACEDYTGYPFPVFREKEMEDNTNRFRLDVHHIDKKVKKEPPYFIDHWKKVCCNHNFMYDFMDDRIG
ncbi:uncharacterized protein LOC123675189 [Harmonia axyridis]|uniref:uncharacterized protein LOC123675189 n=1 Tax=Harmonia axyridis TaxID=115357 RepID=UPI001E277833|nr:uncharacterized protein LOC123675189 [Harmonia axyridis]